MVTIRMGGRSVQVSESLFKKGGKRSGYYPACSVKTDGERWYIAVYMQDAMPYRLHCVNAKSGASVWQAEVWGMGTRSRAGSGPPPSHEAIIAVGPSVVALFGVCNSGTASVEAFDSGKGTCLFRFSTDYWRTTRE